jgi:hypothetical protein
MNTEPKQIIKNMSQDVFTKLPIEFMWEENGNIIYKITDNIILGNLAKLCEELGRIEWGAWVTKDGRLQICKLTKQI